MIRMEKMNVCNKKKVLSKVYVCEPHNFLKYCCGRLLRNKCRFTTSILCLSNTIDMKKKAFMNLLFEYYWKSVRTLFSQNRYTSKNKNNISIWIQWFTVKIENISNLIHESSSRRMNVDVDVINMNKLCNDMIGFSVSHAWNWTI